MNENDIFKGRLRDLANAAYNQNRYTYTNFLNAADMDIYYKNKSELDFAGCTIWGGREAADRVMLAFGREDDCGYEPCFPIAAVKVTAVLDKFSDDLSHRDFLGALMNLGIEREMIGDIVTIQSKSGKHSGAYVFCVDTVADYITDSLTKIKHTSVKCEICDVDNMNDFRTCKEPCHIIAASARMDAVIAAVTGLSRSNTALLFRNKSVTLNGRIYENSSYQLKSGDVFSAKGFGKYEFAAAGSVTRKGRLNIELLKFM